jgi:hypothetical protein
MSKDTFEKVRGAELKVGDRIAPWGGRTATITGLDPYRGPLAHLWDGKAQVATLCCKHAYDEFLATGMTIDPKGIYDRALPGN